MVIYMRRFALHDVDDEQRDAMLTYHSEKIAIAFGLLSIVEGSTVRVLKNVRVCGDWHSAIKLILKIIGQMVVLRGFDFITSGMSFVLAEITDNTSRVAWRQDSPTWNFVGEILPPSQ